MVSIVGIIPARFGSTRFSGKPLAKIGYKSMIEWTYNNARRSMYMTDLVVATDDERIFEEVNRFGGKVIMTSTEHETGTDRLIEAINKLPNADIVVNIQGDEPGIDPALIDGIVALKLNHRDWEMTTAAYMIQNKIEYNDPNRVKVVFAKNLKALYFSRSLIPSLYKSEAKVYRHLGIYCYERNFLLGYNKLPKSDLEKSESLEQLRALEAGATIGIFVTDEAGLSVDTPEDLMAVEKEFKAMGWI